MYIQQSYTYSQQIWFWEATVQCKGYVASSFTQTSNLNPRFKSNFAFHGPSFQLLLRKTWCYKVCETFQLDKCGTNEMGENFHSRFNKWFDISQFWILQIHASFSSLLFLLGQHLHPPSQSCNDPTYLTTRVIAEFLEIFCCIWNKNGTSYIFI